MYKIIYSFILLVLISSNSILEAKNQKCATMDVLNRRIAQDPSLILRMQNSEINIQKWIESQKKQNKILSVITIPIVVHVLWHESLENISDEQIYSQIELMNKDFRMTNTDALSSEHPFREFASDTEIEFCLATVDPDGNLTSGITRTYTDSINFKGEGAEKSNLTGGKDNWDPNRYLNFWVCNLGGTDGTLGYASFPEELAANPKADGVVIDFKAFGSNGTAKAPNHLGRTATHEVGHWLNLRHIWGDDTCATDFVDDTEKAIFKNHECPTFPHRPNNACGSGPHGEMYMNYMDYVDDNCMNMFTKGQSLRMKAALSIERAEILNSKACQTQVGVDNLRETKSLSIFPNPASSNITINLESISENIKLELYDLIGNKIQDFDNIKSLPYNFDINQINNGVYYLKINNGLQSSIQKVIIAK